MNATVGEGCGGDNRKRGAPTLRSSLRRQGSHPFQCRGSVGPDKRGFQKLGLTVHMERVGSLPSQGWTPAFAGVRPRREGRR